MKTVVSLTQTDDIALAFIDAMLCQTIIDYPNQSKRALNARDTVAIIRAAFQATQQKAKG